MTTNDYCTGPEYTDGKYTGEVTADMKYQEDHCRWLDEAVSGVLDRALDCLQRRGSDQTPHARHSRRMVQQLLDRLNMTVEEAHAFVRKNKPEPRRWLPFNTAPYVLMDDDDCA